MNQLPKSVRDELARQQRSEATHPDADLLTAFSEGTATSAERAKVQQHLATCSDCREVIFLATPTIEASAPVTIVPKTSTRWFPVWAPWAAAAAILLIATFTFTRKNETAQYSAVAKRESVPPPAGEPSPATTAKSEEERKAAMRYAPPSEVVVGTRNPAAKDAAANAETREGDKQALTLDGLNKIDPERNDSQKKEERSGAASFGIVAGAADRKLSDSMQAAPAPRPVPPQVANSADVTVPRSARNQSLKPGPAAPAQNQIFQNQQVQAQNAPAAKSTYPAVGAATETVEVEAAPTGGYVSSAGSSLAKTKTRVQWRLSTDGKLERSSAGSAWTTALDTPNTKFTVVANIGAVVWAGGTDAALFRSDNDGATWVPIQLPGTIPGSGPAIARIEFRDAWVGSVAAVDGRTWSTKDRGLTWLQH